jgi:hypothetical protein
MGWALFIKTWTLLFYFKSSFKLVYYVSLEIILERISLVYGSSLNYSKLINDFFFMAFNPHTFGSWFIIINKSEFSSNNYCSLVQVINEFSSIQLDCNFLGYDLILIIGSQVLNLWVCISKHYQNAILFF